MKYAAKLTAAPAMTSIMECCFRNIVETQMSAVVTANAILIGTLSRYFVCHAVNSDAKEPITWIDGQTFVFVS